GEFFTETVLSALPKLRIIARSGVGYDRVDLAAATARSIPVTITPTANFDAVAETAIALLMAVAKSIVLNDRRARGDWERRMTRPVRGSTLGLFGLGRIGRAVAIRAKGLGMQVLACETHPDQQFVKEQGIELVDFDRLLGESDYLSIHCPLNQETEGLFDRNVFARMKPDAVLINTARGPIVAEADLTEALRSGQLHAAGLDVMEQEPPASDNPLLQLDNVVLSPHIGGEDTLSSEMMGIEAATCIVDLKRGHWPQGAVVNDELQQDWTW
ncbi:MAG: phosphoglycerate dehydrogenase, partial [Planctomycetaceae bacterium]|nr:phosphoglycerate dehydrogenase [Planctomycetaceae bacterium]